MLFLPATAPAAMAVIYWGIGWSGVGLVADKATKLAHNKTAK